MCSGSALPPTGRPRAGAQWGGPWFPTTADCPAHGPRVPGEPTFLPGHFAWGWGWFCTVMTPTSSSELGTKAAGQCPTGMTDPPQPGLDLQSGLCVPVSPQGQLPPPRGLWAPQASDHRAMASRAPEDSLEFSLGEPLRTQHLGLCPWGGEGGSWTLGRSDCVPPCPPGGHHVPGPPSSPAPAQPSSPGTCFSAKVE